MKLRDWVFLGAAASVGALVYGALVEANRLVLERRTLRLPRWPERLRGYKIAVVSDLHLKDQLTQTLAERAVAMALDADPDMVVIPGDVVAYWKPAVPKIIGDVLEPLAMMNGNVIVTPGNHEYWAGDAEWLRPILDELGIRYLRNEAWRHGGITWIGIDSANAGRADPRAAFESAGADEPKIVLWHEPDVVSRLPDGAALMISGHSHGGQFRLPNGWSPMTTLNGRIYKDGFFPNAPTPLYVSRGVGTTGPPSRLFCPPEVSLLRLLPAIRPAV
ncbi:MAG: metallophosphoesterase [Fimbriimonadaceae bacterium]